MADYLQRILFYALGDKESKVLKEIATEEDLGRFWINRKGEVISVCRGTPILKHTTNNGNGYEQYKINGKTCYKHRLLAEYFLLNDDPEAKTEVHHLDFNRYNNSLDNLIWLTPQKHRLIHTLYNKWQRMELV